MATVPRGIERRFRRRDGTHVYIHISNETTTRIRFYDNHHRQSLARIYEIREILIRHARSRATRNSRKLAKPSLCHTFPILPDNSLPSMLPLTMLRPRNRPESSRDTTCTRYHVVRDVLDLDEPATTLSTEYKPDSSQLTIGAESHRFPQKGRLQCDTTLAK